MLAIKSETRVIRPFSGAYAIRTLLNDAELHLYENDPESLKDVRIVTNLEGEDIPTLVPRLSKEGIKKICKETGLLHNQLNLVVLITVPSAKKFQKIGELSLTDAAQDTEIPLSRNIFEAASQRGGAIISVAIVLNTELEEKPLQVSKYGHWLVKKDFRLLRSEDDSQKIDIQDLTDEIRKRFSLPQSTAFYVDLNECEILTDAEGTIKSAVTLYFEPDLLAKLRRETKTSEALLVLVVGQILPSITRTAVKKSQISDISELDPRSPLHEFFKQLSISCKVDIKDVFKAAQDDPERLHAFIQAEVHTLKLMKEIS